MVTKKGSWIVGLVALLITSLPQIGSCADVPLSVLMRDLSAQNQVEIRIQQLIDFEQFSDQNTGEMLYEPTGERFKNYNQIKAAIPTKKQELVEILMKLAQEG